MKIFFYLILFSFFTNNSFALDREAKARKLYVENAKILKVLARSASTATQVANPSQ